jgi:hypothetical protein
MHWKFILNRLRTYALFCGIIFCLFLINSKSSSAAECCTCIINGIDGTVCIQKGAQSCDNLSSSPNTDLKEALCKTETASAKCKKVAEGGICLNNPVMALEFKKTSLTNTKATTTAIQKPFNQLEIKLNTDLPNLEFENIGFNEGKVYIPYLAQYISAIYKLSIGISLIAAALMIVYGGFLYIVSASGAKARSGKDIIKDALIGLVLVLGSYIILSAVAPNTIKMKSLEMAYVEKVPLDEIGNGAQGGGNSLTDAERISTPNTSVETLENGLPTKEAFIKELIIAADELQVDSCALIAICEHETGFKHYWAKAYMGAKKETAGSFGCGVLISHLSNDTTYSRDFREKFSDYPPKGAAKIEFINWILSSPRNMAYVAAKVFKSSHRGPAVIALNSYAAGGQALINWIGANPKCSFINQIKTISEAVSRQGEIKNCLPEYVGVPDIKCTTQPNGKKKCDVDNSKACPGDKYECKNPKLIGNRFIGQCSDGIECMASKTSSFIPYILRRYDEMKKYGCKPL